MEEKKQNGGARPGAGRKPVAEEQKVNSLFISALKEMYNTDTDDEAKILFVKKTLMESQRGQLFIAEHIFGKAPQEIKQTNLNIDAKDLDEEEIKRIQSALENNY
jgi:hypothetical protein